MNQTNGVEAALKQIPVDEVSDISDHLVEIEVLIECRHQNVIRLLETFYYNNKLFVSIFLYISYSFCSETVAETETSLYTDSSAVQFFCDITSEIGSLRFCVYLNL